MIKINLLPKRDIKKPAKVVDIGDAKSLLIKLAIPFVASLILIGVVYFYMEKTKSDLTKEIDNNKKTLAQLKQKIEEIKRFEQLNKEIETKTKLIENLRNRQHIPVTILSSIAKNLPDGVWLTELSFGLPSKSTSGQQPDKEAEKASEKKITTKGFGFSNFNIVAFVENLKKAVEFTDVTLLETQQTEYEKIPVYRFTLEFKIKE